MRFNGVECAGSSVEVEGKPKARDIAYFALQFVESINPSHANHAMQSLLDADHRIIKSSQRTGEIVHHQRNPSNLSGSPSRLHSRKVAKKSLSFALASQPTQSAHERKIAVSDALRPEFLIVAVFVGAACSLLV